MEDKRERSRQEELRRYSQAGMMEKAQLENGLFDAKMKWYEEEKGSKTLVEIVEMIEAAAGGGMRCA